MDADRDAHEEVLWAFGDCAVEFEEVGFFECLESKIVEFEITIVDECRVEGGAILGVHDDVVYLL